MRSGLKSAGRALTNELHETTSSASEEIPLPPQPHSIYKRTDSCDQTKVKQALLQPPFPSVAAPSPSHPSSISSSSTAKQSSTSLVKPLRSKDSPFTVVCVSLPALPVCLSVPDIVCHHKIKPYRHLCTFLLRPLLDGIGSNMSLCSKFSNPKSTKI